MKTNFKVTAFVLALVLLCSLAVPMVGLLYAAAENETGNQEPVIPKAYYEIPLIYSDVISASRGPIGYTAEGTQSATHLFNHRGATNGSWDGGTNGTFVVDFGIPTYIDRYTINTEVIPSSNALRGCILQSSTDNVTFTTVDTVTDAASLADFTNIDVDNPTTARYYKFIVTASGNPGGNNWGAKLYEISFYSSKGKNVALNKYVIEASANRSYENQNEKISSMLDGNPYTLWINNGGQGAQPKRHYAVIDLGEYYNIKRWFIGNQPWNSTDSNKTRLTEEFSILYSDNGQDGWQSVFSKTNDPDNNNNGYAGACNFTARYVKLDITNPSTSGDNTVRISEFQLFGEKAAEYNIKTDAVLLEQSDLSALGWSLDGSHGTTGTPTFNQDTANKKVTFNYELSNNALNHATYKFALPSSWNLNGAQSVRITMERDSVTAITANGQNERREAIVILQEQNGNTVEDEFSAKIIVNSGTADDSYQIPITVFKLFNQPAAGDGKLDLTKVKNVKLRFLSNVNSGTSSNVHSIKKFGFVKGAALELSSPIKYAVSGSGNYTDISSALSVPAGTIRVSGAFTGLSVSDTAFRPITAVYKDGQIVGMDYGDAVIASYLTPAAFETNVNVPSSGCSIKTFIWTADTTKPIIRPATLPATVYSDDYASGGETTPVTPTPTPTATPDESPTPTPSQSPTPTPFLTWHRANVFSDNFEGAAYDTLAASGEDASAELTNGKWFAALPQASKDGFIKINNIGGNNILFIGSDVNTSFADTYIQTNNYSLSDTIFELRFKFKYQNASAKDQFKVNYKTVDNTSDVWLSDGRNVLFINNNNTIKFFANDSEAAVSNYQIPASNEAEFRIITDTVNKKAYLYADNVLIVDGKDISDMLPANFNFGNIAARFQQWRWSKVVGGSLIDDVSINVLTAEEGSQIVATPPVVNDPYPETEVINDEFDRLRVAWKNYLVGGMEYYDPQDSDLKDKINEVTTTAQTYSSSMRTAANRTYLWSNYQYSYSSKNPSAITGSYARLKKMAVAYRCPTGTLYGDTALRDKISGGLDWLYANWYNESKNEKSSTKMGNWWEWEIGTPQEITDILVLMYPVLSQAQIDNYNRVLNEFCPDPKYRELEWLNGSYHGGQEEGANLVWKCSYTILHGIITKNAARLNLGKSSIEPVFQYINLSPGAGTDGFYTDGTFIQHTATPYNGGYGASLLEYAGNILTVLAGSQVYDLSDDTKKVIYDWVLNSFEPIIYKGAVFDMFKGRGISSGDDRLTGNDIARSILKLAKYAPNYYAYRFKAMVKYWINDTRDTSNRLIRNFYNDTGSSTSTLANAIAFKQLVNDPWIESRGSLSYNKQLYCGDRVVHAADNFSFGISMSSSRIYRYSNVNDENVSGWYTGAGMTTLYNDDYRVFSGQYWATQDKERLPGTTSERRTLSGGGHTAGEGASEYGGSNFAGGASVAGRYGAAGMQWVEYGGTTSIKKSWFMLDKEIVALGADLHTAQGNPYQINTTIDNRTTSWQYPSYMSNGVTETQQALMPDSGTLVSGSHQNTKWIYSQNGISLYFPTPVTIKYEREKRAADYRSLNPNSNLTADPQSYVTTFIDHGVNPNISGAAYEYVILPGLNKNQTAAYAQNPEITVLVNNGEVQAVAKPSLGIFAANFWLDYNTTVSGVTCDKKASVITKTTENSFFVGVSDPTHANIGKTTLYFSGKNAEVVSKDERINVISEYPLIIEVNMNKSDGRTISAEFILR